MENYKIKRFIGNTVLQILITTIGLVIGLFINDYANNKASEKLARSTLISLQKEFSYNKEELKRVGNINHGLAKLIQENEGNRDVVLFDIIQKYGKVAYPNFSEQTINNMLSSGVLNRIDFKILASIGKISASYQECMDASKSVMSLFRETSTSYVSNGSFEAESQKTALKNLIVFQLNNLEQVYEKLEEFDKLLLEANIIKQ